MTLGQQRATIQLAAKLSETHNVLIYNEKREKPFYSCYIKILNGRRLPRNVVYKAIRILYKTLHHGKIYNIKLRAKEIACIIDRYAIDTVVLAANHISFVPYLKRMRVKANLIAWIHNKASVYLDGTYYKAINTDILDGIKNADTVVCLTEFDVPLLKKLNVNTIAIPNSIIPFGNKISNLDVHYVSFVGRINVHIKGLDYLCAIAARLPGDWKISIAGGGSEDEMRKFWGLVDSNGAREKIVYRGELRDDGLLQHLVNSSIYIMTSRWEGFPLVLGEAMSVGLPVIAFEQNGSSAVLGNGNYGILVNMGDIDMILVRLEELIAKKEIRVEYQQKALRRVADFTAENISAKWQPIL